MERHHEHDNEQVSPEERRHSVRLALDKEDRHGSSCQAVMLISAKIGCAPQALNDWVSKAEVGSGNALLMAEIIDRRGPWPHNEPQSASGRPSAAQKGSNTIIIKPKSLSASL